MTTPGTQLLLFSFGADAKFEGQLVGALERIESGGALRIRDALFLRRDPDSGEIAAVAVRGDGAGGIAAPLLGFRLDAAERSRTTQTVLTSGTAGVSPELLGRLAVELQPGAAVAAVLIEHRWLSALDEAVSRTGGTTVASEWVDAAALNEVESDLLGGARGREPDQAP